MSSLWNPDNVRDVAESVGISQMNKEVVDDLARDIDFRVSQVIEEALKFMRHARRTTLHTDDITQALRVLDVEPLFGYDTTRPMRFGEASIGPGQPLYYIEDEEVDFEKLINAPLPKVPRDVSFTAHWLAVDGVQPSIPQNPSTHDSRNTDLLPKGPGANPSLSALAGNDSVAIKPLVKHVLSSELQLYFERITTAVLDETNEEYRNAAYNSLHTDPGLHQLVPYFVHFVNEKVTHSIKELFVLRQMLCLLEAILRNQSLFIEPYIASFIPSIITCLTGKHLGNSSDSPSAVYSLRELAASLIVSISQRHGKSSHTLKPRLARTLLKTFLDPTKPLPSHYGALFALQRMVGPAGVRTLIIPNLRLYDAILREGMADDVKRADAEQVISVLMAALMVGASDVVEGANGVASEPELRTRLVDKVGEVMGTKVVDSGNMKLVKVVLHTNIDI
ncbi:DUF1546-domain-containing protein [Trichodelitschia bisporula]|uniref:TBP-associated factor 6 n=1 Tax=Trichodelitschia bisporula TaxID=703511 RepID=A0A6G1I4G5_9PEZI|nr:DUF1546-domain-containing protein [Trichodelitschia bisporula]